MKRKPTSTQGEPVLDEGAFQQLLAAVYILQEHHDRLPTVNCAALSDGATAENVRPIQQVVQLTPARVAIPVLPPEPVIPMAQADREPFAPQNDSVIPPETAYQLSVLASQLEALMQQIRIDSEWTTRLSVAAAREIPEERRAVPCHAEGREKAGFEQPQWEPAELMVQQVVPSETSNLPHRIVRRQIFRSNELFLRTATVFAVAAVLFLLLGASVHRLLPAPDGLALSSEVPQQQTPFHRTNETKSLAATKPVEPTAVADRLPASAENSGSLQKGVVKLNSLHPTYRSEADLVAEENSRVAWEVENRIRADRRLQMTQVQVRASDGIITLSGQCR